MTESETDSGTGLIMKTLITTGVLEIFGAMLLFALPGLFPFGEAGAWFLGGILLLFAAGSIGVALWYRAKVRA